MVACFAFWLWRDELAQSGAPIVREGQPRRTPRLVGATPNARSVPAVIVLPIIAALGYFWLYAANAVQLYQFQQQIAPGFPFTFSPMLHLPVAVAVAAGFVLYAGVNIFRALIFIAAVEAFSFGTSYAYAFLVAETAGAQNLANNSARLLFGIGATALGGVSYLLAASIWAPTLRRVGRWVTAIALWTIWAQTAGLAIVQFSIRATPLLVAVIWSLRVFMAACFGFWLWHDARHDIVATSVQRQQAAASRTGIRSRSAIAQFAFFLVALAVVLVAIEAALRGFSASRLIFPPPSEVLGSLPRVLVEQAPALLLTAQQTVIASIVITAIGATAAIVLLSSELLRAAMLPWIAALSRMPMLLLYLPVMIFVGNRLTAVVTAVFAGWAMAAIAWLDRLGPITSSGRKTAPDAWLASLFSVWTGVLPAAFAGVVSVELFSDDGFGNGIAQAFARLDDVTFFNQILLAVLFSGALTFLAKQVGGVGQTYSGASALITPSPDALSATRLLVLLLLLIGWEAIARYIGNNALMPSITELTVRGLIPLSESAIFYSSLLATASAVGIGDPFGCRRRYSPCDRYPQLRRTTNADRAAS